METRGLGLTHSTPSSACYWHIVGSDSRKSIAILFRAKSIKPLPKERNDEG